MKLHYEERVQQHGPARSPAHPDWTEQWIYLSLWYATLFVTAEGWLEQNLANTEIQELLADEANLNALRRFRNGVFHFQPDYFDRRLIDFVALAGESAAWVRALHSALGRDLLARMNSTSDPS